MLFLTAVINVLQDAGLEHQLVAIEPVEDRAALEAKVNAFTAVGDFANAKRCALRLPQSFSMAVADLERTSLKVTAQRFAAVLHCWSTCNNCYGSRL